LGWIDEGFGGAWSSDAAAGGIWIAEDRGVPVGFAAFDARGLRYHWLRAWSQRAGVGVCGPCGVLPAARGRGIGRTLLHAALFSLRERGYRQALLPAVPAEAAPFFERFARARFVERVDLERRGRRFRTTVLASGSGSNFGHVAAAAARGALPLDIAQLVVNRPGAYALERAAAAGIPSSLVAWERSRETREDFDARIIEAVAATAPDLVLLLGWMHVLPATFVARFPQTLNLHPAFLPLDPALDTVTAPDGTPLPAFRGARAVDDALAAGVAWSGATVHRLGVAVDRGAVVARAPLALVAGESRAALDERLHALERRVLDAAIARWAHERP
jgi:phosphoribosylglycinamide formyltransferase-1